MGSHYECHCGVRITVPRPLALRRYWLSTSREGVRQLGRFFMHVRAPKWLPLALFSLFSLCVFFFLLSLPFVASERHCQTALLLSGGFASPEWKRGAATPHIKTGQDAWRGCSILTAALIRARRMSQRTETQLEPVSRLKTRLANGAVGQS